MFGNYQSSEIEPYLNYGIFGLIFGIFVLLYYLGKDEKSQEIYQKTGTYASANTGTTTEKPSNPTVKVGGSLGGM